MASLGPFGEGPIPGLVTTLFFASLLICVSFSFASYHEN